MSISLESLHSGIFNLFYLVFISQDDYHDPRLTSFHPDDPWFNHFTRNWGNFMRSFLLVKPLTLEDHITFYDSLVESYFFYKGMILKYWSSFHLYRDIHYFYAKLGIISPDKVWMREYMYYLF